MATAPIPVWSLPSFWQKVDGYRACERKGPRQSSVASLIFYLLQAEWWQSQAISTSFEPASLQNWLQYFSPFGGVQTQG
jgi:hypothetical protein